MPFKPKQHRPLGATPPAAKLHTRLPRESPSLRGYGREWQKIRNLFIKQNPLCVKCKAKRLTVPAKEIDHILPKSKGGGDEVSNLQALCKACHSRKTATENGGFKK
jgi:5-methylcytosine-specific restriction protein A